MENTTESKEPLNRKQAKKANKRRKLEAFLRIAALNDQDRQASSNSADPPILCHDNHKESKRILEELSSSNPLENKVDSTEPCCSSNDGPSPKRHKPDHSTKDDEEMPFHSAAFPAFPPAPCNMGSWEQQLFFPTLNGTFPQVLQHPNAGVLPPVPFCPNFLAVQVVNQPIFAHFINGIALLAPGSSFNPAPFTFLPPIYEDPFGNRLFFPTPSHHIPLNENPPAPKTEDIEEDLLNLRKSIKARKMESKATPIFHLSAVGDCASLTTREEDRIPIFTSDLQRLLLKATARGSSRIDLRLGRFNHISRISGVKLLLLEGVSLKDIERSPELSLLLTNIFPVRLECVMPTAYEGALLEEIAAVPLSAADRTNLIKKWGTLEYALRRSNQIFRVLRAFFPIKHLDGKPTSKLKPADDKEEPSSPGEQDEEVLHETDKFPRTLLLMSAWQMIEEGYPLPIKGNLFKPFTKFGMTKDEYKEVTPFSPMYGVDCEMCLTTLKKHELTRVSVINEKHELIYDTLVKPRNKIINYLTEFSGITKEMMEGVTTTLEDVQEKLREILEPDAILVGQSLNSDLVALQLMHPYVIDTSIIFNLTGDRARKSKLKYLAKAFLEIDIQDDAAGGHDPIEDAATALKLVQLKLANSLEFGDAVLSELKKCPLSTQDKAEQEKAGEKQKAAKRKNAQTDKEESKDDNIAVSVFRYLNRQTVNIICHPDIVEEYHKYTYIIDNWDKQHPKKPKLYRPNIVRGQDERDIVDKAVECMNQSFCIIAHVHLEEAVAELIAMRDEETTNRLKTIISDFSGAVPVNSVVIVVLGGNKDGANGAVYFNIRKRKSTPTITTTNTNN